MIGRCPDSAQGETAEGVARANRLVGPWRPDPSHAVSGRCLLFAPTFEKDVRVEAQDQGLAVAERLVELLQVQLPGAGSSSGKTILPGGLRGKEEGLRALHPTFHPMNSCPKTAHRITEVSALRYVLPIAAFDEDKHCCCT